MVRFPGKNGKYFYSLVKENKIDFNIFNLEKTNLGRFDIHYLVDLVELNANTAIRQFYENCRQKVKKDHKNRTVKIEERKKGPILFIGNRKKNVDVLRIYQKHQFLEFELERTKKEIQIYQNDFFSNQLTKFENKIVPVYYKQLKKFLVLDSSYTGWINTRLRSLAVKNYSSNSLISFYIQKPILNDFVQKERFFFNSSIPIFS